MDPIPTSIIVHWLAIAETTLTFLFNFLTLSNAFFSINDREMKSESGFSLAMASQPFQQNFVLTKNTQITPKLILRQNMCENVTQSKPHALLKQLTLIISECVISYMHDSCVRAPKYFLIHTSETSLP